MDSTFEEIKKYCACGMPQSSPIPHEHSVEEFEIVDRLLEDWKKTHPVNLSLYKFFGNLAVSRYKAQLEKQILELERYGFMEDKHDEPDDQVLIYRSEVLGILKAEKTEK